MALFTRLDEHDLEILARRYRLPRATHWQGLEEGTVNSNYFVDFGDRRTFLRVNEGKTEEDVRYEAQLLAHVAAHGVTTPRPFVTDDGEPYCVHRGRYITLFPRVDGEHRDLTKRTERDLAAVGRALAVLHEAGADFPRRRESRYAFARIVERRRFDIPAQVPADIAAGLADVDDELGRLASLARERAALPRGVIHGDLFPDNVLWDGERLAALLDFEQASDGTLLYDLAVVLNAWCFGEDDFDRALCRALFAGYQDERPLDAAERRLLGAEARFAAARFTVTRLTDVELNPAVSDERKRAKSWRRFHARLLRLRALGDQGVWKLVTE